MLCPPKKREEAESHWETFGGREWNIIAWGDTLPKSLEGKEAQNSPKLGGGC